MWNWFSILAEWIGENLQDTLGFPDKGNVRAGPGSWWSRWTAAELNHILQAHVVDGTLTTFGCVEWESEQFWGVMRARCYPFKMPKRRFHGVNTQVYMVVYPIIYSTYMYIPVHTSMYQYIPVHTATSTYFSNIGHTGMSWYVQVHGAHMYIPVCTGIYLYILVHTSTGMYLYIPVHTGMYRYVPVYNSMYQYILVCTGTY